MLDFLMFEKHFISKTNKMEIYPTFRLYPKPKDLMIRGGDFYAVWIEEQQTWSTDEDDVLALIDIETRKQVDEYNKVMGDGAAYGLYLYNSNTPVPVTVWGDNTLAISQAPAVVYVHAEKESAADLGRQTLKAAVTVKTAATVDTSRQQLDQLCAAVEQAAAAADLPLGTGCAVMAEGFGPVFYEKDSYSCRSLALRVFIRF